MQSELSSSVAREPASSPGVLLPGVTAGLFGAVVMALFLIASAAVASRGALYPLQIIGATLVQLETTGRAHVGIAAGMAIHLALSIGFGVVFAALLPRTMPLVSAIGLGVAYALFVMGIMASLIVPAANPVFGDAMQPIGGMWVIAHAVFGAALGVVAIIRHRPSVARAAAA